jgi:ATP synthase F1 complex assembly factor 1
MKVELLKDEDKESIGRIWTEYYADKDGISAVIPSDTYNTMFEASQKYPLVKKKKK